MTSDEPPDPGDDHGSDASTRATHPVTSQAVTGPLSDQVLAELVREFADAVLVADPTGTIIFWNVAAERLFGWTAAEVTGRTMDVIIPERLRARHWEGWHHVMSTADTKYGDTLLEVPALHRQGHRLSIAFTVSLLTEPGSKRVTAVAAVLRDDTARWQQRRDQRDEIARLRALAGTTSAAAGSNGSPPPERSSAK
jgi:PAS domain S-box-containing protein